MNKKLPKIETISLEGKEYKIGYKVVTLNLESLGLANNPTILTYPINEWYYIPQSKTEEGIKSYGGIWLARKFSGAKKVEQYMQDKYNLETRTFKTLIDEVLYVNNYRLKTNGICMIEEILKNN